MAKLKKKKDKLYGPVSVLAILICIVSIMSFLFSILGIESYKTVIANNTMETTLITVKNIISFDGIKFLIGESVTKFSLFKPLVLIIIALLGISICEKSGLLSDIFSPFKRVKLNIVVFITLLVGIISTIIGDYSYIFLIPLVGVAYKYLGKNPVLGILIVFLGITIGYGTGVIFNYNDYLMGILTEKAATVDIDKNYAYSLFSNIYIMIFSTIVLSFIGTFVVDKFLVNKLPKKYSYEEEELISSPKAKKTSLLIGLFLIILFIYMILPAKMFGAGILLDSSASRYMEKLLGENSPFGSGLVIIITLIFIACGFIYGKLSGNMKNSHQFSLGLSKNFENLGFMFVLMFFISELSAIIEWTNLGTVIASKLLESMGTLQYSGVPLIITLFVVVIIMSVLLPFTIDKWNLAHPVIVPLFMRSNITPNMTQFIFKVADGVGKACSPVFIYYIITLAFLEKYRISEKNQVSIFGTLKLLMPVILIMGFSMLLLIILWYVMGLPIGIGTYSTL